MKKKEKKKEDFKWSNITYKMTFDWSALWFM